VVWEGVVGFGRERLMFLLEKKSLAIEGYAVPFVLCKLPLGCCRSKLLPKNYLIADIIFWLCRGAFVEKAPESSSLSCSWHHIEMQVDTRLMNGKKDLLECFVAEKYLLCAGVDPGVSS
jgi:hypothetical protein